MIGTWTDHLWQSTCFAILAGLLTLAFRCNRAEVRYWLWFSASLKFLLPFAVLVSWGRQFEGVPAARPLVMPTAALAIAQVTRPFSDSPFVDVATISERDWAAPALIAVWLFGVGAILSSRVRGWLRIQVAVRVSVPMDMAAAGVEIRTSPGLLEPGVVGILRPILMLPEGIVERLTAPQLRAVLSHELCHVQRHDNLLAATHMLVETLFWFHPLVWWIGGRLVEERERACDEGVLRLGSDPAVYAEAILSICRLYVESPLACVSGVTGADLRRRIEGIVRNRVIWRLSWGKRVSLMAAGLMAVASPFLAGVLRAQAVQRFEVASVKPCRSEARFRMGAGYSSTPGHLNTGCMPLLDDKGMGLIQRAYVRFANGRPQPFGIVPIKGGPSWIKSELFEIKATAEGNASPPMMEGPMMQALLEERFQLKVHRETLEAPVYELIVAKGGPKLKAFQAGSCVPMPLTFPRPELPAGQRHCKTMVGLKPPSVEGEGSTIGEFAKLLNLVLDRPVIDRTGITGQFNLHVDYAADGLVTEEAGPSLFGAVQEQLGLKLVRGRGPREFIVIDHVARPAAN